MKVQIWVKFNPTVTIDEDKPTGTDIESAIKDAKAWTWQDLIARLANAEVIDGSWKVFGVICDE